MSLQELLLLSDSLHKSLSLRQLVRVHEALLLASSSSQTYHSEEDSKHQQQTLDTLLEQREQIHSKEEEARKLLVVQYLLYKKYRQDAFQGLQEIVIQVLMNSQISEDLREAIIDAVVTDKIPQNIMEHLLSVLQTILSYSSLDGQDNKEQPHYYFSNQCRLLVRLYQWLHDSDAAKSSIRRTALEMITREIDRVIQKRPDSLPTIIKPIVNDLLPIIAEEELVLPLIWTYLWNLKDNSQKSVIWTIQTTLLCSILPILLDTELPLPESPSCLSKPIKMTPLWQLIQQCLQLGANLPQKKSWIDESWDKKLSSTNRNLRSLEPATAQLLRRRGLYLLRVLIKNNPEYILWNKYVACYETLEMEYEAHLIDQVWETVAELFANVQPEDETRTPPVISWKWMSALLARILTSYDAPVLRKVSLYRLFKGQAGIIVGSEPAKMQVYKQAKNKARNTQAKQTVNIGAPLSVLTTDFLFQVVIPSFDTLEQSVGLRIHLEETRNVVQEDMRDLLASFLVAYVEAIRNDEDKLASFFRELWSPNVVCSLHRKTVVDLFYGIAKCEDLIIPVEESMLTHIAESLQMLISLGLVVQTYHESLLESLAAMLAMSKPKGRIDQKTLLNVLALYSYPETKSCLLNTSTEEKSLIELDPIFLDLSKWIINIGGNEAWTSNVGATLATAFVDGMLFSDDPEFVNASWDPSFGASKHERRIGRAISLFCTIGTHGSSLSAGQLLWPSIHKGISCSSLAIMASWKNAGMVSRALILLENGCRLKVLSGLGNGDLVVDRKTNQILAPPQTIEGILSDGVNFIFHQINAMISQCSVASDDTKYPSILFTTLVEQLRVLHEGFPSSSSINDVIDNILRRTLSKLMIEAGTQTSDVLLHVSLTYGCLICGGTVSTANLLHVCRTLIKMQFSTPSTPNKTASQAARSLFQIGKWGAVSYLLQAIFNQKILSSDEKIAFIEDTMVELIDAVEMVTTEAFLSLFACFAHVTRNSFIRYDEEYAVLDGPSVKHLEKLIKALLRTMSDGRNPSQVSHMLHETCALIFSSDLLKDEEIRLQSDPECLTPVRNAFRELMKMAGTLRPHISRAVLLRISCAWVGKDALGVSAIPYREDIVKILLHKEEQLDESCLSQTGKISDNKSDTMDIPSGTDNRSIARAFAFVFLSKLRDLPYLPPLVVKDLLHYIILRLMDEVRPRANSIVMFGTYEYCLKMRGWQGLCILSRFVSTEIIETVRDNIFEALAEPIHGQIRYFIEIFALQCARKFPEVFGRKLVSEICRRDLTIQQVTSLMIIMGNLVVGRFQKEFFSQYEEDVGQSIPLPDMLAGVIPWLGSTQGFSRAIAQLLVHKLIPLVVDTDCSEQRGDSNWYLQSIFRFLEENGEMSRLRKKQLMFFENYEVDSVCTPEGILNLPVDVGGETNPGHLVEAIKQTLQEVYEEGHVNDTPTWRQIERIVSSEVSVRDDSNEVGDKVVNFQRKIIPLDALNLALEDIKEQRLRNLAGRRKQKLIVCASLVDKVPNLGGLARTSEIFAAERLIIPDLRVTKMDNFKSLSVGAGDWIEIEECNESDLLQWLRAQKERGYFIVGLEQTSSSVSLAEYTFPRDKPVVLLLGKEKEGIPVDYLAFLDVCIELPQLGIIRSLNVHVTGAIALWEFTRQNIADKRLLV